MMKLQLLGWAPDLDPSTPGVLVDTFNVLPTTAGLRPIEGVSPNTYSTIGFARTMIAAPRAGATPHTIVSAYSGGATASTCALYEIAYGGGWTLRGTYTAGTHTTPVMFRQFDGEIFAVRAGSPMKKAAPGADFTAVSGAPSAGLIEANRDFLIAFNTDAGYDWHCSAYGNGDDWALSVSNQCVRGALLNKEGSIVCVSRNRDSLLAWTPSQTWLARYVGAPEVWQWEQLSRDIGCVGAEAACETPYGTVWVAKNDIYIYDGANISPINTSGIKNTLFNELLPRHLISLVTLTYDRRRDLLWLFASGYADTKYVGRPESYCYHMQSKKWAVAGGNVMNNHLASNQIATPDYFGYYAPYADIVYDEMIWIYGGESIAFLGSAAISTLINQTGYFQTGIVGDNEQVTMVRGMRAKYTGRDYYTPIGTATLYTFRKAASIPIAGGSTATQTATLDADYKYPFRQSGRWHSVKLSIHGEDVVSELDVDIVPMGKR